MYKYVIAIIIILMTIPASSTVIVPDSIMSSIYSVINYSYVESTYTGPMYGIGNGFIVEDDFLGKVFVTCRHLAVDKKRVIGDSIGIKLRVDFWKDYCVEDCITNVYLRRYDGDYYHTLDSNIDLIAIRLTDNNTQDSMFHWIEAIPANLLSSNSSFPFINSHTILISYSNKLTEYDCLDIKFGSCIDPIYPMKAVRRINKDLINLYVATTIDTDFGDSGAPVFSFYDGCLKIVGIHNAKARLVHPISYELPSVLILDLLKRMKFASEDYWQ